MRIFVGRQLYNGLAIVYTYSQVGIWEKALIEEKESSCEMLSYGY